MNPKKTIEDLFMARGLGNQPYSKMAEYCYVRTHRTTTQQPIDFWSTRLVGKQRQANIMKTNQKLLTEGVRDRSLDVKQVVIKRGASEYIKLRNGTESHCAQLDRNQIQIHAD